MYSKSIVDRDLPKSIVQRHKINYSLKFYPCIFANISLFLTSSPFYILLNLQGSQTAFSHGITVLVFYSKQQFFLCLSNL